MFLAAFLVVAGAAVAFLLVQGGGDGVDHPDTWDPRVEDLVAFVEDERDLDFEHPVEIEFLAERAFREEVTSDAADLTDEERREIEAFTGTMRALGLIEGDVDLFEELNTLTGEGVLAFYSVEDQRVVVKGETLDTPTKVTLVHELTHALQDQHFGLGLIEDPPEDATDGELFAYRALGEGDAGRIEVAYLESLPAAEQEEYAQFEEEGLEELESNTSDVPPVLEVFMGAPYALGDLFVAVLDEEGGNDAVDDAFRDPPTSDEHLLDPWTYLDDDDPERVPVPGLPGGEEEIDSGDFGALTWYLVLAERIDLTRALEAVDGWGGDSYVVSVDDGRPCVRAVFEGETDADADEMESALAAWNEAGAKASADIRRTGKRVILHSCDPGADAAGEVRGHSEAALGVPLFRGYITLGGVQEGAPVDFSRCYASEIVDGLDQEQLLTLEEWLGAEEEPPGFAALAESAARACIGT
ncbi:MAG TPA: hypothetical protein VM618_13265 [Acidimicrobiia bacterium]|nr:hypothetical protein [Acidimicrobiia bacterium]